jgi:hypothetical protein
MSLPTGARSVVDRGHPSPTLWGDGPGTEPASQEQPAVSIASVPPH